MPYCLRSALFHLAENILNNIIESSPELKNTHFEVQLKKALVSVHSCIGKERLARFSSCNIVSFI